MTNLNFTRLLAREYGEEVSEERWQTEHKETRYLDERGFDGDEDVVLFGLETMEDELTTEQCLAISREKATHRMVIPVSMATPAERRQARKADIDSMENPEWNRED